jgi:hypothetical protein
MKLLVLLFAGVSLGYSYQIDCSSINLYEKEIRAVKWISVGNTALDTEGIRCGQNIDIHKKMLIEEAMLLIYQNPSMCKNKRVFRVYQLGNKKLVCYKIRTGFCFSHKHRKFYNNCRSSTGTAVSFVPKTCYIF